MKSELRRNVRIERISGCHIDGSGGWIESRRQRRKPPAHRSRQACDDLGDRDDMPQRQPAEPSELFLELALADRAAVDQRASEWNAANDREKQRRLHLLGQSSAGSDQAATQVERHEPTISDASNLDAER
jgi:hypothetical protein